MLSLGDVLLEGWRKRFPVVPETGS